MTKRMLIDATHPEETRVVVINGNRLEEFDYETATKEQIKSNIYLARVTRVEASLQAAFVEYGGNRQGFLAFSEIHPDYYRISDEERAQLLEDEKKLSSNNPDFMDDDIAADSEDNKTSRPAKQSDQRQSVATDSAQETASQEDSDNTTEQAATRSETTSEADSGQANSDDDTTQNEGGRSRKRQGRGNRRSSRFLGGDDQKRSRRRRFPRKPKTLDLSENNDAPQSDSKGKEPDSIAEDSGNESPTLSVTPESVTSEPSVSDEAQPTSPESAAHTETAAPDNTEDKAVSETIDSDQKTDSIENSELPEPESAAEAVAQALSQTLSAEISVQPSIETQSATADSSQEATTPAPASISAETSESPVSSEGTATENNVTAPQEDMAPVAPAADISVATAASAPAETAQTVEVPALETVENQAQTDQTAEPAQQVAIEATTTEIAAPVADKTPETNTEASAALAAEVAELTEQPDAVDPVAKSEAETDTTPAYKPKAKRYKIQDVIKRQQIMLIQVTKEERGNKGAALTTYLSLAGRYCVLMPNTARGGGVSRKITNLADRKRLKSILEDLHIPEGMAVIVRTAGAERSRAEIKRDYEYLLRLWEDIRTRCLQASAPEMIYEEGDLIKRSIRDLYQRDIDEILVEGEDGYKSAKNFMRMLMPSHARKIHNYRHAIPLYQRYKVENQLDEIHNPTVTLKSGGYIVINQTEALVAIDVNSGRATRERHIEDTALNTNLEAADEIALQLRLRDLAGLIVVDFIDMEDPRYQAQVERRLKEAMKDDRARVQFGKISSFGLMELSRQRLRPSVLENITHICPVCSGTGVIRSIESSALHILRAVEEDAPGYRENSLEVYCPADVALYILNQKRQNLLELQERLQITLHFLADNSLYAPNYRIQSPQIVKQLRGGSQEGQADSDNDQKPNNRRNNKNRRDQQNDGDNNQNNAQNDAQNNSGSDQNRSPITQADGPAETGDEFGRKKRGKRGGKRRPRRDENNTDGTQISRQDRHKNYKQGRRPQKQSQRYNAQSDKAQDKPAKMGWLQRTIRTLIK